MLSLISVSVIKYNGLGSLVSASGLDFDYSYAPLQVSTLSCASTIPVARHDLHCIAEM